MGWSGSKYIGGKYYGGGQFGDKVGTNTTLEYVGGPLPEDPLFLEQAVVC